MTGSFDISAVVPTFNSSRTIEACLRSLALSEGVAVEVVVVDNHSTDDTAEIGRRLADRCIICGPERSAQRNTGVRFASAEFVAVIDSDMVLEPRVLALARKALLRDRNVEAVVLSERSFGAGFFARCRALGKDISIGNPLVEGARVFRRSTFIDLGGYDEDLHAGEDWDFSDRVEAAGGHIARVDEAVVWHDEGRVSLPRTFQKKRHYGRSLLLYLGTPDRGESRRRLLQALSPAWMWRGLARPHLLAGLVLLRGFEVAGLATGVVEAWAKRR
ncbi:MAG: glycosyltransferase [Actinomycetia bacterium]|nr:glycosyltransferase [Actinomycetes bacterium]